MTYLELAQKSLDTVTKNIAKEEDAYGITPSHEMLMDIAKTAALVDIAASLFEIQRIAERIREGGGR